LEKVKADLQAQYGDKAQSYMNAVDKAYPETNDPSKYVDLDIDFRLFSIRQADLKAASGSAPVYMYMFNWQSPILDGIYKAVHCMELGFVFDNIDRTREMTGGGIQAQILAANMSKAWTNFAKTGNPNHSGLPNWPAYSAANGSTMIFDNVNEIKNHYDKELLDIAVSNR
jgi:para-nitrobenzyl esterase